MTDLSQIDTNTLITLYKKAQTLQPKASGPGGAAPQKVTEGQAKDGFNAKRMTAADGVMSSMEAQPGFDPTLTGVGAAFGREKSRKYNQGRDEWADSLIRLTTGAAATKDEIDQASRTYFPQFGDSEAVVRQKAEARRRVGQDALTRAGPGAAGAALPGERAPGWSPLKVNQEKALKGGQARVGGPAKPVAQGQGWKVISVE
jgi:hypothetical protein